MAVSSGVRYPIGRRRDSHFMYTMMLSLVGCGFLQTYEQAVQVICDAPDDCVSCDRGRQSPEVYHAAIGLHLEQSLWNGRGKDLVNRVAREDVAKGALLREAAEAVGAIAGIVVVVGGVLVSTGGG